jgi:murein DD-endopeptidase MepM/ murein hydrolase activator NlpD
MSAAKPTPRYVERIRPNIGLVGPTTEAQVIPIRRVTPAYMPAIVPAVPVPVQGPRRAIVPAVPVARRPWQLLLVPPTPGTTTKTISVARWQARVMIASLAAMLLLSAGGIASVVVAVQNPDLLDAPAEAALLRSRVAEMEDSLASASDDLAESDVTQDSLTALLEAANVKLGHASAKALPRLSARKRALHAPRHAAGGGEGAGGSDDEAGPVVVGPRSVEGLPVVGRIASGFSRSRRHPILHIRRPHLGVDVAAPTGTPITAPAAGWATFVGRKFGYGLVVEIQHPNGVMTRYAHLKATMLKVGERVTHGALIATVGRSGITTGPHLHYEVLVHGRQVDPLRYRIQQPAQDDASAATATTPPVSMGVGLTGGAMGAPPVVSHEAIGALQAAPAPR